MAVLTPRRAAGGAHLADPDAGRSRHGTDWLPALDGLRGLAVAAVLCFHGGWRWAQGGYLGVSVFFTLSGFLVARLVLRDRERPGSLLAGFWRRRVLRLSPALALVLVGVGGTSALGWLPAPSPRLAGDLVAAATQVANWRFIASGQEYGALFDAPSPVLHLWSLSIEAQLYLAVPLLLVALGRTRRRRLLVGVAAVTAILVATTVTVPMSATRAYYATDVRAVEALAGVLVGIWLAHEHRPGTGARRGIAVGSVVGLVVLGVAASGWAVADLAIERGALALVAAASAVVVAAGALDVGPVTRLLSWRPLGWLGRISYGLYLCHWPVFIVVSPARTGLDGLALFGVRMTISVAIAVASYLLVESPIRRGVPIRVPAPTLAVAVGVALVVAVVALAPVDRTMSIEAAAAALPRVEDEPPPPVLASGPHRIVLVGDSQAVRLATGLRAWGAGDPRVISAADLGCGIGRGGEVRYHDWQRAIFDDCTLWRPDFPALLARLDADLVLVMTGPWDFADRRLAGDDEWRRPGDPVYDAYLLDELVAAGTRLRDGGAPVVWLTAADVHVGRRDVVPPVFPADDPARALSLNALVTVAAERTGGIVVDYAGFLGTCPGGVLDSDVRPDGVHLERDSSVMVAEWLGPLLLAAMDDPPEPPDVAARTVCVSP